MVVVGAYDYDGFLDGYTGGGGFVGIVAAGVAGEGAAGIVVLVGDLPDLLSNEVVSGVADAGVRIPVVRGMLWAGNADSSNPHISNFAETAVLEEILVSSALWRDEGVTALCVGIVDLVKGTLHAY